MNAQCPEGIIVSELRGMPLILRCDLDGGHPGGHSAHTESGDECDWPRIAGTPYRFEEEPPF